MLHFKINRRRPWKIKVRLPVSVRPGKVIEPDTLYIRDREKRSWKRDARKYLG